MRAIVIEMVAVGPDPNPIWWRGIGSPAPASWGYVFEDFTGDDTGQSWALAAAVFVAQTRRRTGRGPTFAELFAHLLPDTCGLPAPFPPGLEFMERRRAISGFRGSRGVRCAVRVAVPRTSRLPRRTTRAFRYVPPRSSSVSRVKRSLGLETRTVSPRDRGASRDST